MGLQLVHFPPDQVAETGLTRLNGCRAVQHSCSNPCACISLCGWFGPQCLVEKRFFWIRGYSCCWLNPFVTYPYQETYETSIRCRQTVPPEILRCGKWLIQWKVDTQ